MAKRTGKDTIAAYKSGADLGSIGIEIVLAVLLGFFGGRWLDGRFGTEPWLQIFGFLAGLGAAVKAVVRATKQMNKIAEAESREQGDPAPLYETDKDRRHAPPAPPSREALEAAEDEDSKLPAVHTPKVDASRHP